MGSLDDFYRSIIQNKTKKYIAIGIIAAVVLIIVIITVIGGLSFTF